MSVKTETQHKGEFLVSEAPGTLSREEGILSSGQVVIDGQVLKWSGTELIAAAGTLDSSDGDNTEDIAGIAYGAIDASSAGPGGAVDTPIVYIARLAEVKLDLVKLYTAAADPDKTAAMKEKLLAKFIQVR
jgi:hypothetical protein